MRNEGKCPYCTAHYSTAGELRRHLEARWEHLRERLAAAEAEIAADSELRADLLATARTILAEHAAARARGRTDALSHCHEAAMQLVVAVKDYLEHPETP